MSDKIKGVLRAAAEKGHLAWSVVFEVDGRRQTAGRQQIYGSLGEERQEKTLKDLPIPDEPVFVIYDRQRRKFVKIEFLSQPTPAATTVNPGQRAGQPKPAALPEKKFDEPAQWNPGNAPANVPGNAARHFHNPYNFVPAPEGRPAANNPLHFGPPLGHHAYHKNTFSGSITVALSVKTPLIIQDTARKTLNGKHFSYPVLTDEKGNPVIPPTSLKGVLRSAYEAVTLSRMGVLDKHDKLLGRRMAAGEGLAMVPARIIDMNGRVELLTGSHAYDPKHPENVFPTFNKERNRFIVPRNLMYAAWLPFYERPDSPPYKSAQYGDGTAPKHKDHVVCRIREVRRGFGGGSFTYWRVEAIEKIENKDKLQPAGRWSLASSGGGTHNYLDGRIEIVSGYVCRTGQNIGKKHDERVFFYGRGSAPAFQIDDSLFKKMVKNYERLIENYWEVNKQLKSRRQNQGYRPDQFVSADVGETELSYHVYKDEYKHLKAGDLCYVLIDKDRKITGLYPVIISRELGDMQPADFIPGNVKPAESSDELSPADRVFGWVNGNGSEKNNSNMHKGQFRIASIRYVNHRTGRPIEDFGAMNGRRGLPLAILSAPKVEQARFYLSSDASGAPHGDRRNANSVFYFQKGESKNIRGRKFYPHHRRVADMKDYWNGPLAFDNSKKELEKGIFREYVRQGRVEKRTDDQNRSILGWINPEATFEVAIQITNLNSAELGALLWLLDLPKDHFFRMGFGKPLGFGSVRLELKSITLADGDAIAEEYLSLGDGGQQQKSGRSITAKADIEDLKQAYFDAFRALFKSQKTFDENWVIKAFLSASAGFDTGFPTHYPRLADKGGNQFAQPPHDEGKNFEWFAENLAPEKKEKSTGRKTREAGPMQALPPLWEEVGLSYLPIKAKGS